MVLHGRDIIERFSIEGRNGLIEVDSVIDTGAQGSAVPSKMLNDVGAVVVGQGEIAGADGESRPSARHRVRLGWVDYLDQGYVADLEVEAVEGEEVLIGMDFLARFELTVDMHHHGLVGHAPANAQPLLGGGYTVNAPPSYLRELNGQRAGDAKPGVTYRPHPAFRFTISAFVKTAKRDP